MSDTSTQFLTIWAKGNQALTTDLAFLANANPTQADVLAQVRALTRQMVAIIRLYQGALDTTDGT